MQFSGFDNALFGFLAELKANNNRDWFNGNKDRYIRLAQDPALDLIEALSPLLAQFDPPHRGEAKLNGSLRRIHRDTRFSKDKTPFHTYLHLIFWTGNHPLRSPGLHVILSSQGVGMGAGMWALDKDQLSRYRASIADELRRSILLAALDEANGAGCHLEQPALKRVPKGVEVPAEAEMLARQTGIVVRTRNEAFPQEILSKDCVPYLAGRLSKLAAVNRWLVNCAV